jgi:hypothetical protein
MLKNGRNHTYKLKADGCSCCNTRQERRTETKILKRKEERQWKKEETRDN